MGTLMKVILVSGIHGVGKSTLCRTISERFGWPHYSCSKIIKENSEYKESSKKVDSTEKNQMALIQGLRKIKDDIILLDGHFCLLSTSDEVINLDFCVFNSISPELIVNVTCNEEVIYNRLLRRDGEKIPYAIIKDLQKSERNQAIKFSEYNNIRLIDYVSPNDVSPLMGYLHSIF